MKHRSNWRNATELGKNKWRSLRSLRLSMDSKQSSSSSTSSRSTSSSWPLSSDLSSGISEKFKSVYRISVLWSAVFELEKKRRRLLTSDRSSFVVWIRFIERERESIYGKWRQGTSTYRGKRGCFPLLLLALRGYFDLFKMGDCKAILCIHWFSKKGPHILVICWKE